MKKQISILLVLFTILLINIDINAQDFKGNISGTFGIINPKIRVQYEMPFGNRASGGICLNYYLVNWKGPKFDFFARIYGNNPGNAKGFFGQAKLGFGLLSTLNYDNEIIVNKHWTTFGFGVAVGYKFLIGNHFTIEPLMGFQFYSPPFYRYGTGYDAEKAQALGETVGWYITTGLPLDFQLKFGYQF